MNETVWRLSGEMSKETCLAFEAILERMFESMGETPPTLSYFEQKHSPLWRVELYFTGKPEDRSVAALLTEAGLDDWPYLLDPLPDTDWVSESQRMLDPVSAGRFYVHGSHDAPTTAQHLIDLEIDAGQAFGTGRHETTWACLKALDDLNDIAPGRILDLGTGSGVLAMAAHRLWPEAQTLATDIDPVAVEVTRSNLHRNHCQVRAVGDDRAGIAVLTADGLHDPAFRIEGPFDLIIANILAGPLIAMAADLAAVARGGAHVLLSGLLREQEDEVLEAYDRVRLRLQATNRKNEWSALLLQAG